MQLKYRGQPYSPSPIVERTTQTISLQFLGLPYQANCSYQPERGVEAKPVLQFRGCSYAMS